MNKIARTFVLLTVTGAATGQVASLAEVLPVTRLLLQASVDGRVAGTAVAVGDRVEAGRVLLQLDAPELVAEVERARAAVELAEIAIRRAELDHAITQKQLNVAERECKMTGQRLPHIEEQRTAAQTHLQNVQQLFAAGRMSSQDEQQARIEMSRVEETWETVGEQVKACQDRVEVARLTSQRAELAVATAKLERDARRAELGAAELRLAATQIRSPFAAVVNLVLAVPGEWVHAGETLLLELVDCSRVRLRFTVDVADAARLKPGGTVEVLGDDGPIRAKVATLDPVVDAETQTLGAEIVLDNADGAWLAGTFVDIRLLPE